MISYTVSPSRDTATLTVNGGTGGGDHPNGSVVAIRANAPPEGVVILSNPFASMTTATIPSVDVTINATYTGD